MMGCCFSKSLKEREELTRRLHAALYEEIPDARNSSTRRRSSTGRRKSMVSRKNGSGRTSIARRRSSAGRHFQREFYSDDSIGVYDEIPDEDHSYERRGRSLKRAVHCPPPPIPYQIPGASKKGFIQKKLEKKSQQFVDKVNKSAAKHVAKAMPHMVDGINEFMGGQVVEGGTDHFKDFQKGERNGHIRFSQSKETHMFRKDKPVEDFQVQPSFLERLRAASEPEYDEVYDEDGGFGVEFGGEMNDGGAMDDGGGMDDGSGGGKDKSKKDQQKADKKAMKNQKIADKNAVKDQKKADKNAIKEQKNADKNAAKNQNKTDKSGKDVKFTGKDSKDMAKDSKKTPKESKNAPKDNKSGNLKPGPNQKLNSNKTTGSDKSSSKPSGITPKRTAPPVPDRPTGTKSGNKSGGKPGLSDRSRSPKGHAAPKPPTGGSNSRSRSPKGHAAPKPPTGGSSGRSRSPKGHAAPKPPSAGRSRSPKGHAAPKPPTGGSGGRSRSPKGHTAPKAPSNTFRNSKQPISASAKRHMLHTKQQAKLQKQAQKLKHNTSQQFQMLNDMSGFIPGKAGMAIQGAQMLGVDRMIEGALHDGARSDVNSAKAAVMAKGVMNFASKKMNGGMMGMGGGGMMGGLSALSDFKNLKQEMTNVEAGMAKAERRFAKQERKQARKVERKMEKKILKKMEKKTMKTANKSKRR